jgi:hypothetical protein
VHPAGPLFEQLEADVPTLDKNSGNQIGHPEPIV